MTTSTVRPTPLRSATADPFRLAETADPLSRSRLVARVLDDLVTIPGTRIGVGLDSVIGLVPGIGDSAGMVLSTAILVEAVRNRVPVSVLLRMAGNLMVDAALGYLPGLGDLADVAFRANRMNAELLRRCVAEGRTVEGGAVTYLLAAGAVVLGTLGVLLASVLLTWWLLWVLVTGIF